MLRLSRVVGTTVLLEEQLLEEQRGAHHHAASVFRVQEVRSISA
jgi:hypothetical protein